MSEVVLRPVDVGDLDAIFEQMRTRSRYGWRRSRLGP